MIVGPTCQHYNPSLFSLSPSFSLLSHLLPPLSFLLAGGGHGAASSELRRQQQLSLSVPPPRARRRNSDLSRRRLPLPPLPLLQRAAGELGWSSRAPLLVQSAAAAAMAREGRSHSGLANVLQQGDGTTCGQSRYRKLADIVAEKAAAPEIDSC